jgi:tRNA (guanine37-N1)-methyltransferase
MHIDIVTIFPELFDAFLNTSLIKRAIAKKKIQCRVWNLRDFSRDKHRKVDDTPYGGGSGMVMKPEPFFEAVRAIRKKHPSKRSCVIALSPQGTVFTRAAAWKFSRIPHLIFLCGHYEGIDERVMRHCADCELSIGDFVLTGGELPAMIAVDAITRLVPGVVGKKSSVEEDSFENNLLKYPQYTKPRDYNGMKVPEILISGNHAHIAQWRKKMALRATRLKKPALLKK